MNTFTVDDILNLIFVLKDIQLKIEYVLMKNWWKISPHKQQAGHSSTPTYQFKTDTQQKEWDKKIHSHLAIIASNG